MSRDSRFAAREEERYQLHRRMDAERARKPAIVEPTCACGGPPRFNFSSWRVGQSFYCCATCLPMHAACMGIDPADLIAPE